MKFAPSVPFSIRWGRLNALPLALLFWAVSIGVSHAAEGFNPPLPVDPAAFSDVGRDSYPNLASDGNGTWIIVWTTRSNSGPGQIDMDIFYSRSVDGGKNWTMGQRVNNTQPGETSGDGGLTTGPWIETDGAGVWLVAWASTFNPNGQLGDDFDIFYARSNDNGNTWSDPRAVNTNASTDSGDDEAPKLLSSGNGVWVLAWESRDSLNDTIGIDRDILFSRSFNNGLSWTAPSPINSTATVDNAAMSVDRNVSLANDKQGFWMAVWESTHNLGGILNDEEDLLYSVSEDDGRTWAAATPLNSNAASDLNYRDWGPSLDTDGNGNWVAVWYSNNPLDGTVGIDNDILVAYSDDAVTWSAPAALGSLAFTDNAADFVPRVHSDGDGNWIAVWESLYAGLGLGSDSDILMSRSTDNGHSWSYPSAGNTNAQHDARSDFSPQIVDDGNGTWILTWWSFEDLGGTLGMDADVLFSRSTNLDAGAGDAWFGFHNFPQRMVTGQFFSAELEAYNSGEIAWTRTANHRIGVTTDSCQITPLVRYDFPENERIEPGERVKFDIPLIAPDEPGMCHLEFRMLEENVSFFGSSFAWDFRIDARSPNDALFIERQIPFFMDAGTTSGFELQVQNLGTENWTLSEGYSLAVLDDTCDLIPQERLLMPLGADIAPDGTVHFTGPLEVDDSKSLCRLEFRMVQENVEFFGERLVHYIGVERNSAESWNLYR